MNEFLFQNYLREYVLPPSLDPYPRNSTEFFLAVMAAASVGDCVNPLNALDLSHRTRFDYITNYYKCGYDWISFLDPCMSISVFIEVNLTLITDYDAQCSSFSCLGNETCLIPPACYYQLSGCLVQSYHQSSPDTCPTSTECTVDQGCGSTEGVCAYCPGDGSQCTVVEGVTSSSTCNGLSACELPNGDVRFDLSAKQCLDLPGSCSGECAEPVCRPLSRYQSSACAIYDVSDAKLCNQLTSRTGSVDEYGTCVSYDLSESDCDALSPTYDAEYLDCESVDVSLCNSANMSYVQYDLNYLGCGVSDIGPCRTKETCVGGGGTCSDTFWMGSGSYYTYTLDSLHIQRNFCYGVCSLSGLLC